MKHLIDPSCGRLEELLVGNKVEGKETVNYRLMNILSAHSSLKVLTLYRVRPSLLSQLIRNTCLTELCMINLDLICDENACSSDLADTMSELVTSNKTLKHLTIHFHRITVP